MYIESDVPENYLNSISKEKLLLSSLHNAKLTKNRQSGNFINQTIELIRLKLISLNQSNIKPNLNARVKINDYSNKMQY